MRTILWPSWGFHVIVTKQSVLDFAGDAGTAEPPGSQICHCAVAQAGICMKRETSGSVNKLEEMQQIDADLKILTAAVFPADKLSERKSRRDQHLESQIYTAYFPF